MPIFCFLRAIWRTFTHPLGFTKYDGETIYCSGHNPEVDTKDPVQDVLARVTVTFCKDCGHRDISWEPVEE